MLKKKGYRVVMTRRTDIFVPLDERTRIAHAARADLFISIHANAANSSIRGIESYWFELSPALASRKDIFISLPQEVGDSFKKRSDESCSLTSFVHASLCAQLQTYTHESLDRKARKGGIQVLMGAHMPATLIEVGFLSHEKEAQLLKTKSYQQKAAQGICHGIEQYLSQKRTGNKI